MLAQLTISNFAIVRGLDINFQRGMTAITGETGAGKSIAIDALGLCLGGRAEADMVRQGSPRADLCARFNLKSSPSAHQLLLKADHQKHLLDAYAGHDDLQQQMRSHYLA
nr:Recombination protein N [Candidatus Pantoea persica]